jgi:DNA polymerase-1
MRASILVIDMNYIMMRNKFALKSLYLKDGTPSGAVKGSLNEVVKYYRTFTPDYLIPAFDCGKSKLRTQLAGDYKGQRQKHDSTDYTQFSAVQNWCLLEGLYPYYQDGVEGDDIVAKVVADYADSCSIKIVTADHDMRQLISEHVKIVLPKDCSIIDESSILSQYGFNPAQLVDMWSLTGDSGDNIKGAKGFGPKKAAAEIRKYGSVFSALDKDDKLAPYRSVVTLAYQLIKASPESVDKTYFERYPNAQRVVNRDRNLSSLRNFYDIWELNESTGFGLNG